MGERNERAEWHTSAEVQRLVGLPANVLRRLVKEEVVKPRLGPRRQHLFSFRDLVVLRAAARLLAARVSPARVAKCLARLADAAPLESLRLSADGHAVVVTTPEGQRWQADSGQLLLALAGEEASEGRVLSLVERRGQEAGIDSADDWFVAACALEERDRDAAEIAYRRALADAPTHVAAATNLGRLLHERGALPEAEAVYRAAAERAPDDAGLRFNLGVLLHDLGRHAEAEQAYLDALRVDARHADCHYNLATLYDAQGRAQEALRHFSACRRLEQGRD